MEIVSENRFSGKTYFHTIASRLWQIPSLYGFCAVAANVNSALGVKLGSKLTGPVNIKGCKEEQVRQCLGFCTADLYNNQDRKSAVQKPKDY